LQDAGDGHEATGDTEALTEFGERGIGLLADEFEEPCLGFGVEFGGWPASVCFGLYRAGLSFSLQESYDAGKTNGEEAGELANGTLAPFDGSDNAFT
jgi:hypothetical protein